MPPKQVENQKNPRTPSCLLSGPTGHHLFFGPDTPLIAYHHLKAPFLQLFSKLIMDS